MPTANSQLVTLDPISFGADVASVIALRLMRIHPGPVCQWGRCRPHRPGLALDLDGAALWAQACPRSQCDRENAGKGEGVITDAAGACAIAINYGRATDRRIVRVTSILAADILGPCQRLPGGPEGVQN